MPASDTTTHRASVPAADAGAAKEQETRVAGMGTGTPNFFWCPEIRGYRGEEKMALREYHRITRTGQTKPNPSHRRTQRTLNELHEWGCSCGRTGWSRIYDILSYPVGTGD